MVETKVRHGGGVNWGVNQVLWRPFFVLGELKFRNWVVGQGITQSVY